VRLKALKPVLERGRECHPVDAAGFPILRAYASPTLADVINLLRRRDIRFAVPNGPTVSLADFLERVVLYARALLHPATALAREDTMAARQSIVKEGRDLYILYKHFLANLYPWHASEDADWFQRLVRERKVEYIAAIRRVRFLANATALATGAHEFFIHGAKALSIFGRRAESLHEEAAEHLFQYWWLVCRCMGGMKAAKEASIRSDVLILAAAIWAGCPRITDVPARLHVNRAYAEDRGAL
jgi:hypothetical protein